MYTLKMIDEAATTNPTPEDLAEAFCNLDSEGMAKFFNAMPGEVERWAGIWEYQLACVVSEYNPVRLTDEARVMMGQLGAYAND